MFVIFVQISWERKGQKYPLTAGTFSFLSSEKFKVEHRDDGEWNLMANRLEMNDTGIYVCRISTQSRLMTREIHLTVRGMLIGRYVSLLVFISLVNIAPPVTAFPLASVCAVFSTN